MASLFLLGIAFSFQSCFQDLGQDPAFNYPEQPGPPEYSPLKLSLPFEDKATDVSNYGILTTVTGDATFPTTSIGAVYQGGENSYILVSPNPASYPGDISVRDTIANLGSFTIAFWMNSEQATKVTGVFSISRTDKFWGNLDVFLESNSSSADQAFFKMHIYNGDVEKWVGDARIDGAIGDWVHMTFRYDANTELLEIFKDGEVAYTKDMAGFGSIAFTNMGQLVVGTLQFQTDPSLTTSASAQSWAQNYKGQLKHFNLYNKAISNTEIAKLASKN